MAKETEIRIDGVIGVGENEINSQWVRSQLPTDNSPIVVKIHSEGGSVFEGFAIHDVFANYAGPKRAVIESSAFSIASFIPMAFDEIEITPNGYMMLHNPYMGVEGDDEDFAKNAVLLGQLKANMVEAYSAKTGKTPEEIIAILKQETYLNAKDAVANGFVNRITAKPVTGRVFARLESMPHGVVTALFGAGSDGEQREPTKEPTMSESQPVAATVQEIKSAFPKAKSDFIVKCMERSLPLASVAAAAAEELMAENEELMARVAAMEEELAQAKAMTVETKTEDPDAKAMEDEEEKVEAKARRSGVAPIAQARSAKPSAKARWDEAVDKNLGRYNGNRAKAVAMANKQNPGLRQAMLAEVNG